MLQIHNKRGLKRYALGTALISSSILLSCQDKGGINEKKGNDTDVTSYNEENFTKNGDPQPNKKPSNKDGDINSQKTDGNKHNTNDKLTKDPTNSSSTSSERNSSEQKETKEMNTSSRKSTHETTTGISTSNDIDNKKEKRKEAKPEDQKPEQKNQEPTIEIEIFEEQLSNSDEEEDKNGDFSPTIASVNNAIEEVIISNIKIITEKRNSEIPHEKNHITINDLNHKLDDETLNDLNKLTLEIGEREGFKGAWREKIHGTTTKEKLETEKYIDDVCKSCNVVRSKKGIGDDHTLQYINKYIKYFTQGKKNESGKTIYSSNLLEYKRVVEDLYDLISKRKQGGGSYVGDGENDIPTKMAEKLRPQLKNILDELNQLNLEDRRLTKKTLPKYIPKVKKTLEIIGRTTKDQGKDPDCAPNSLSDFLINTLKIDYKDDKVKAIKNIYGLLRRIEEIEKESAKYSECENKLLSEFITIYQTAIDTVSECIEKGFDKGEKLLDLMEQIVPFMAIAMKSNFESNPDMSHLDI